MMLPHIVRKGAYSKLLPLVIGLLSFTSPAPISHAAVAEGCQQSLLLACRQMNPTKAGHTVAYLKFTSRTTFRTPDQKQPREMVVPATLYTQGSKMYFETPQVAMWQDGQCIATVMHAQRLIYLTKVPPRESVPGGPVQFAMLRDSLIQRGKITQCGTVTVKDKRFQRIVLNLASRDQARYRATSLGFLLDARSHIRELTVVYPANSPVTQTTHIIEKQEFTGSSAKLPADARAMVVDKGSRPLQGYRNYRVVDHTKLNRLSY